MADARREAEEEELDIDESGDESPQPRQFEELNTGVLHEEYVEEEEEEQEEEEEEVNEQEEQQHSAARSSSDNSSSSASDDENDEDDDDLFGPGNEDYVGTSAQSPFPVPSIPPLARNDDYNRRGGRGGTNRGDDRNSFGGFSQQQGPSSSYRQRDNLVAEMRLGPIGHQDETLRINCPFQEPREIACYSRTADGGVLYDDTCLRKFERHILQDYNVDLNKGFDTFVDKGEAAESSAFGDFLSCVRNSKISLEEIHFVSFRNNFNKLLGTAYNRRDPWEMGVHKRRGTVYLDVHKLPEAPPTEFQRRMCYWGYKFEQIATQPYVVPSVFQSLDNDEPEEPPVDANVEFCSVVRTKLGPHRIIMGAEIDCYDIGSSGKKRYTELKTSRVLDQRTVEKFEREKLLKFWIQSYLAGVPRIVCGFRDDNGRLLRSEVMGTQDIAHRMKHKHYWEGGVCLSFADRILCWLYGSVKDDGNYVLKFLPIQTGKLELWMEESAPAALQVL